MVEHLITRETGAATIRRDDTLLVELVENATTGYRWQLDPEPADRIEITRDEPDPGSVAARGAGGKRRFWLRPTTAGDVTLHLRSVRAWDPTHPDERVDIAIHIVP
jgi:inhibitor of cysteine peptidase